MQLRTATGVAAVEGDGDGVGGGDAAAATVRPARRRGLEYWLQLAELAALRREVCVELQAKMQVEELTKEVTGVKRSPAGSDKGTAAAAAEDQEQWRSRGSRGAERCNRGSIREEASGVELGAVAGGRRTARGSIRDWRGGRRIAREMLPAGMDLGLSIGDEEGGRGGSCGRGRQLPELRRRVMEL